MPPSIENLPSIIARPFSLASNAGPQRKDYQRFCLENTVSFLALLSACDLLQYFGRVRDSEEASEKTDAENLRASERLTGIDLDQMSLGKWVRLLRDTTTEIKEKYPDKTDLKELVTFYKGKDASKTVKLIDELVTLRNMDAHGNPIAEDQLEKELDDRQAKLGAVIKACHFLEEYRLVVFDRFDLVNGKTIYSGRAFIGTGEDSYSLECNGAVPQDQPILIHESTGRFVRLTPLLVHAMIDGQENKHLAIFSKTLGEGKRIRYIGLDGHSDIEPGEIDHEYDTGIVRARSQLLEIYSSPEVHNPIPIAELKLKQKTLDVGDEGELEIHIENPKRSVDLSDVEILVQWPGQIQEFALNQSGSASFEAMENATNMGRLTLPVLAAGSKEKAVFEFKAQEQGSIDIGPSVLNYKFFKTEIDRESGKTEEGETGLDRVTLEARDPKSRDAMSPVINISRRYFKKSEEGATSISIGDPFVFEIKLENIGFAAARDLSLELIFPPGIELVDGVEILSTFLNPGESRIFRYALRTRKPGIYQTKVRNLTYTDGLGIRYATRCDDDYRVIVKSDIEREFDYQIEDYMGDLYLSQKEKDLIGHAREDLVKNGKLSEEKAEERQQQAEFTASLRIVREIVKDVAERRGYRLKEEIHEPVLDKRKKADREVDSPRRSIVFSVEGFSFFAMDITDTDDLRLHALMGVKRNDVPMTDDRLVVMDDQELNFCLRFSEIASSENLGRNFIKSWVNQCLGFVDRHLVVWKSLANDIEALLSCEFVQRKGFFQPTAISKELKSELGQDEKAAQGGDIGLIRDPRAHKKPTFFFFVNLGSASPGRRDEFKGAGSKISGLHFLTFRSAGDGETDLRLTETWYESKQSSSRTPALKIEIGSEEDRIEAMQQIEALLNLARETAAIRYFLEDEDFKGQRSCETLLRRIPDFRENRIGVRKGEWQSSKPCLEFYSMDQHDFGRASVFDCMGFMNKNGLSWDVWLNYYSDDCEDDGFLGELEIHKQWSNQVTGSNRWLYKGKVGESPEVLELFAGAICEVAKGYTPDALSVWPVDKREEMLIAMGKESSVLFSVLKMVSQGSQPIATVREEFEKQGKGKEFEKLLRRMIAYKTKYRRSVPIEVVEQSEGEFVRLTNDFETLVEEMVQLNPELDFSEAGDTGRINGYLTDLRQCIPLLANKTVSNKRVQHKGKPLRVARRDVVLAVSINQTSLVGSVLIENTSTQTEKCEDKLGNLKSALMPLAGDRTTVGEVVSTGRSDQSRKLEFSIDHENFDVFASEERVREVKEVLTAFGNHVDEWAKS